MSAFLDSVEDFYNRKSYAFMRQSKRIDSTITMNEIDAKLMFYDTAESKLSNCCIELIVTTTAKRGLIVTQNTRVNDGPEGMSILGFLPRSGVLSSTATVPIIERAATDDEIEDMLSRAVGGLTILMAEVQPRLVNDPDAMRIAKTLNSFGAIEFSIQCKTAA